MHYSEFFDFEAAIWHTWRLDIDGRYEACLDIVVLIQDLCHRLIFNVDIPKLRIFGVCEVPEEAGYDDQKVVAMASEIRSFGEDCDECVDKVFTMVWLARLLDMGPSTRKAAHSCLCDILSVLRATTTFIGREETSYRAGVEIR